jgi:protein-tyrosine phosphatase
MDCILENLFISNASIASNYSQLKLKCITHVLIVAKCIAPPFPKDFTYKVIPAYDLPSFKLSTYFEECISFIDEGRKAGKVLVHCAAGVSRSATIIICYVMKHMGKSSSEAICFVKSKHKASYPNLGFIRQLKAFEVDLKKKQKAKIKA